MINFHVNVHQCRMSVAMIGSEGQHVIKPAQKKGLTGNKHVMSFNLIILCSLCNVTLLSVNVNFQMTPGQN